MTMDMLIAGISLGSFGIFLIIKLFIFRWLKPEELLKSLKLIVAAAAGIPIIIAVTCFFKNIVSAPIEVWLCAGILSLGMYGLMCFSYILCIFGPYETSVRMRLVREIAKGSLEGLSFHDIDRNYNPRVITEIRIRRLKGSGDIVEFNGRYRARPTSNFFFLFDVIAGVLKKWIG